MIVDPSTTPSCYRVPARVGLALDERRSNRLVQPIQGRRLAEHARSLVGSLSSRRDSQIKDALSAVLDAVGALEREVELLHRRVFLEARGVELHDRDVEIGADGLWLSHVTGAERAQLTEGAARLHLELPLPTGEQLVAMDVVVGGWREDRVDLLFDDPDPARVDVIVAFVFSKQRRERRRELDAVASR